MNDGCQIVVVERSLPLCGAILAWFTDLAGAPTGYYTGSEKVAQRHLIFIVATLLVRDYSLSSATLYTAALHFHDP